MLRREGERQERQTEETALRVPVLQGEGTPGMGACEGRAGCIDGQGEGCEQEKWVHEIWYCCLARG
jgi:hypothetical protein